MNIFKPHLIDRFYIVECLFYSEKQRIDKIRMPSYMLHKFKKCWYMHMHISIYHPKNRMLNVLRKRYIFLRKMHIKSIKIVMAILGIHIFELYIRLHTYLISSFAYYIYGDHLFYRQFRTTINYEAVQNIQKWANVTVQWQ